MTVSLANIMKSLFLVLGCVMFTTLIYTISTDGLSFRKDVFTPWMVTNLIDFYINVVPLAAWVCYKESNWISAIVWVILLFCFGRKFSSFRDGVEEKRKHSAVVIARIIFSALGCSMLAALIYTFITDGTLFRKEIFTPWMVALLVDYFISVVPLSVWVTYKESNWINAFPWIIPMILIGGVITCVTPRSVWDEWARGKCYP